MEYGMKFIIIGIMLVVIFLQTTGDFAIHEGRKRAWHRWKGLSLFILGGSPVILWLMPESGPILADYIACIILPYLINRWLFYDLCMNWRLEMPYDYIGKTEDIDIWIRKIFPKQPHQGYLWIRIVAWFAFHVSWIVEWWPGHYLLHL